jgi:hypothetical protein
MQAFSELPPGEQLYLEPTSSTVAQAVETSFVRINHIECGENGVVYVDISIGNPTGILGYVLFSTEVDAATEEIFSAPYPTFIDKRVQLTEPSDQQDRQHQIGLEAEFAPGIGEATYALEPQGRCPGHYEPQLGDQDQTVPLFTAKQNSNCRAGTSTQFEILGFLLSGQSAPIEGRNDQSSWLVITAPDTGKTCWIAASLGDIEGDLSTVAITPTPIPPVVATPLNTDSGAPPPPASDTTPPVIQSVSISPGLILTPGGGCASDPRTTTVTVTVTDPGGIAHVTVFWNLAGDSGQAGLTNIGGNTWQGQAGPVSKTGTLNLFVNAEDLAGNDVLSSVYTVQVQNCIG